MPPQDPRVIVAPFTNERVRQWPHRRFRELVELIVREHGLVVTIVGTRSQRALANEIVRGLSSEWVRNACGAMSWTELVAAIDVAPYVVANNSGVAHLSAERGKWTLCVFGGSHAAAEWMPRGPRVVTISRIVACSPCSPGADLCPNGVTCMVDLAAADVFWRFHFAREAVEVGTSQASAA